MSAPREPIVYPVFLKLEGRCVLVVGAGVVAERKVRSLLEAGARVRVVAPKATVALRQLAQQGHIEWCARELLDSDVEDPWLVVAATGSPVLQRRVADAAGARRVFAIAVDDPAHATAYSGAVVRRPPFTIAISSSGTTPALTRLVREIIEQVLPSDEWVEHAKRLRAKWLAEGTPTHDRFAELVKSLRHEDFQ